MITVTEVIDCVERTRSWYNLDRRVIIEERYRTCVCGVAMGCFSPTTDRKFIQGHVLVGVRN